MKRPAFQFYPADWRKDVELQSCSMAAQGLWINLLCLAHECEPYGHLTINGRAMSVAQIGRQVGLSAKEAQALLDELVDAGVARKTAEGVIFSRRMVADEELRNRRADGGKAGSEHGAKGASHGSKGGRPKRAQGGIENPPSEDQRGVFEPPLKPPPSSSSSSSSSNTPVAGSADSTTVGPVGGGFAPTRAGEVGNAVARAGLDVDGINLADPVLAELLRQGATAAEFEGLAREALRKGVGAPWPWVLKALQGRRADAQRIDLPAGAAPVRAEPAVTVPSGDAAATARYLADLAAHTPTIDTPTALEARRKLREAQTALRTAPAVGALQ